MRPRYQLVVADVLAALREKRLLWPGIATLVGVAFLVALGNWQMHRLAWKEGLIAAIAERAHAAPVPLKTAEDRAAASEDVEYTRVAVSGQFLNDREIHLYALDETGEPGFDVITPLRLGDGSIVLVNRGFVPNELKDPGRRTAGELSGEVSVTGLLRHPDVHGMFIPANDVARNIWYWRDIDAMAAAAGGGDAPSVHRFIVDAEAAPAPPGGWPKGGVTRLELPNRHLEYALTWYGLAAALVGVFLAFAAGRWRQPTGR
jgi:surfeit locus 1 family protein